MERENCDFGKVSDEYSSGLKELVKEMLRVDSSQRPSCSKILEAIERISLASNTSATPSGESPRGKSKTVPKRPRRRRSNKRWILMASATIFLAAAIIGFFSLGIKAYGNDCTLYEQNAQSMLSLIFIVRKEIDENEEYIGDVVDGKREGKGRERHESRTAVLEEQFGVLWGVEGRQEERERCGGCDA